MQIRVGFELVYECPQPTPMLLVLSIHPSRLPDLAAPEVLVTDPPVAVDRYVDGFGNLCSRIVAPAGRLRLTSDAVVNDSGLPDAVNAAARQVPIAELPTEVLVYLLGSRYCETDRLTDTAWRLFGHTAPGWPRVQAIVDFVHGHVAFGYQHARSTKTAWDAHEERAGVCRDYAHLAIAFCRCMNIPARYATGYLGDIGVPPNAAPMDFSGWFEAYLEGGWYTFDARHRVPRIGRVVMAYGRDATDVAISTSFGPSLLTGFEVWTDEVLTT